jgi:hypothetical protein
MAREFDKNIIYDSPPNPFHPTGSFPGTEMFVMNELVVPGAFRVMCAWFAGPWEEKNTMKPHMHNHDEIVMFIGSDSENPRDLGGVIEFWFKDDKYLLDKSCCIFIPKWTQHAPMMPRKVNDPKKPILFVGTVPTTMENDLMYYSREPKWSNFQDPPAFQGVKWIDELKK